MPLKSAEIITGHHAQSEAHRPSLGMSEGRALL
jgi:hypothetical protein